ncbi:MAG: heme NO-binding domain-containing protein [Desulfobulbaceae bacterium]|nr:heme NO-binding domain-containing protein [Desulfobulbaceae bacterium]
MKGVIADCLGKLVSEKFGKDKWIQSLIKAGFSKYSIFLPFQDVEDEKVIRLIEAVCSVTGITQEQAANAFGEYWVNIYAANVYKIYYMDQNSARDFLLKMDQVHEKVTRTVTNAKPPRFDYQWKKDNILIMKYKSARGMMDILVGLVKGVGRFYNEAIEVTRIGENELEIVFPVKRFQAGVKNSLPPNS